MMNRPAIDEKKLLIAIAIIIPIAYFLRLNSYQLIFEEPRRALVALEMLIAGDWLTPTTNGVLYYNKPPLYNWVLIGFMSIFGKEEWVVRLPSILSLFATAYLHYRISKRYIPKTAAILSALFYITSADILFYFSLLGEIDLFYAMIVYLQGVLIFYFYEKKQWHWLFIVSYLLTSAGVLTKGIPSLVFQAITLLVVIIQSRKLKMLISGWHFAGIFLLLLTSGGYFYAYSGANDPGPYLARLFTETFSRSGMEKSASDNLRHLINFPVMLIKIGAPWILLFLMMIRSGWSRKLRSDPFLTYCLWFCIANGLVYFFSPGTRERYLYMFFPFIYAVLAVFLTDVGKNNKWLNRFYLFTGTAFSLGLAAMGIFSLSSESITAGILCIMLCLLLGAALYSFAPESNSSRLLYVVLFMLIARIGFDLSVLPTRKQNEPYRQDAQKMASIIKNENIYFTGNPEFKSDDVRFAGRQFAIYHREEPSFLAFQTSYYLSRFTGKIVQYTGDESLPGYYISEEKYVDMDGVQIYYRFSNRVNNVDHRFVLYKRI